MKKTRIFVIIALAAAVLMGGVFTSLRIANARNAAKSQTNVAAETPTQAAEPGRFSVDGRVVPVHSAELSFPTSGVIAETLAAEGDSVAAGQPLLRLRSAQQQAAVALSKAQLAGAEARLEELRKGAREPEVVAARAALEAAQARLERVRSGPLSAEVATAKASVSEAQAALQTVLQGAGSQQIIAAEADLANAEARLRQSQAAYDRIAGLADAGARPEAAQLEQATNAVTASQARLQDLKRGASAPEVAAARARVQRAQAQLDALTSTRPTDIIEAEAAVRQAQAQLDLLQAGARAETIAAAQAQVAAAQANLAQAEASLADAELRAPFAGVVASLDKNVGESVMMGSPALRLADLSQWQIETEDLTELEVVGIQPGDRVTLAFDALPGVELPATVSRIRPIGQDNRGDIVYTLVATPQQQEQRLLWNMTAVVTFTKK